MEPINHALHLLALDAVHRIAKEHLTEEPDGYLSGPKWAHEALAEVDDRRVEAVKNYLWGNNS